MFSESLKVPARPPWSGGRPDAVYFSPVQIIAILVFILLFLLSYYVLLPSEFGQKPSLFAFCYMIALFALSALLAWSIVKVCRHIQKRSKRKQEH